MSAGRAETRTLKMAKLDARASSALSRASERMAMLPVYRPTASFTKRSVKLERKERPAAREARSIRHARPGGSLRHAQAPRRLTAGRVRGGGAPPPAAPP